MHEQRAIRTITHLGDDVILSELANRLLDRLQDIRVSFDCIQWEGFPYKALCEAKLRTFPTISFHDNNCEDNHKINLILSFLSLHWANDPLNFLMDAKAKLTSGGLFIGVFLGGDTLIELRRSMLDLEIEYFGGASLRVSPMITPYDGAALMQKAGFALPVVDVQKITLTYSHVFALVHDLRTMGQSASFLEPSTQRLNRQFWIDLNDRYMRDFGEQERIPVTFEAIFVLGWKD